MEITFDATDLDDMANYWEIWWPREPLLDTVEAAAEDAKIRVDTEEQAPDGSRWEPWSDNPPGAGYASRRPPGTKLLRDSGDLRDSIVGRKQGGEFIVGSDEDYAQVHQFGSRDDRIPQRQYVGMSDELAEALDGIYNSSFERGWSRLHG